MLRGTAARARRQCRAGQQQKDKAEERSQGMLATRVGRPATALPAFRERKAAPRVILRATRMARMLYCCETTTRVKTAHA
jgi:hypothetical protein